MRDRVERVSMLSDGRLRRRQSGSTARRRLARLRLGRSGRGLARTGGRRRRRSFSRDTLALVGVGLALVGVGLALLTGECRVRPGSFGAEAGAGLPNVKAKPFAARGLQHQHSLL